MINFGYNLTAECPITGDERYKYKASDGLESVVHMLLAQNVTAMDSYPFNPHGHANFHKYG